MISIRKIGVAVLCIAALVLFLKPEAAASTEVTKAQVAAVERAKSNRCLKPARFYQSRTRKWAHKTPGHARGAHKRIKKGKSAAYQCWRASHWRKKAQGERKAYKKWVRMWEKRDKNIHLALKAAAAEYGVSYQWLHACNHSEGGHGWVMNRGGSGAGGPMQFMSGTFYGYVGRARAGNRFPAKYAHWHSFVGQAYTAAYMFKIGQSKQWTGRGC